MSFKFRAFCGSILVGSLALPVMAADVNPPSKVKQYVLREVPGLRDAASRDVGVFPSPAEDQGRTPQRRPDRVAANPKFYLDTPPPPCEPAWYNFWCVGSSSSTCKSEKSCQSGEGLCLDEAGHKCYTYNDSNGSQQCNSCT